MTAGRDHRRTHAAVADGTVQGLLADAELTRRLARADQVVDRAALETLDVIGEETPMTARRDERRLEQSPRDRAEDSRSADTKALC